MLFLSLRFLQKCGLEVSTAIAGVFLLVLIPTLYFSQTFRGFTALLLMSLGLRQGRNLLITAGTTLVISFNIRNILGNIQKLASSIICNLEAKRISIDCPPLGKYIQMLRWMGEQLKKLIETDFVVAQYKSDFNIRHSIDSRNFSLKLREAEKALNETEEMILAKFHTASLIAEFGLPILGILLLVLFTALRLKRYHKNTMFENIFIMNKFRQFDKKQRNEGKPTVLPLTEEEAEQYISVPSLGLTAKDGKAMVKFSIPVFTHCIAWSFFIAVDCLLYKLIEVLRTELDDLEPFRVPVKINVLDEATLVFIPVGRGEVNEDFSYNVSLFEKKCLPEPSLPLYSSMVPLSVVLALLVLLVLVSSKLTQLRHLIYEQFFPDQAQDRVACLHSKILRKRSKSKVHIFKRDWKTLVMQT
ncbi:dendritic cell-specific transmembrane protein [Chanos chanos]|uniref:Dendritic cell-specific transmembrane protein n=1 Tax=Chanos chanos TaxID=29144 RepID=A0A6J2W4C6_CHACN|nr:dendritic cell-specific transmembrane protein-like [Chanos chanos]